MTDRELIEQVARAAGWVSEIDRWYFDSKGNEMVVCDSLTADGTLALIKELLVARGDSNPLQIYTAGTGETIIDWQSTGVSWFAADSLERATMLAYISMKGVKG